MKKRKQNAITIANDYPPIRGPNHILVEWVKGLEIAMVFAMFTKISMIAMAALAQERQLWRTQARPRTGESTPPPHPQPHTSNSTTGYTRLTNQQKYARNKNISVIICMCASPVCACVCSGAKRNKTKTVDHEYCTTLHLLSAQALEK